MERSQGAPDVGSGTDSLQQNNHAVSPGHNHKLVRQIQGLVGR